MRGIDCATSAPTPLGVLHGRSFLQHRNGGCKRRIVAARGPQVVQLGASQAVADALLELLSVASELRLRSANPARTVMAAVALLRTENGEDAMDPRRHSARPGRRP